MTGDAHQEAVRQAMRTGIELAAHLAPTTLRVPVSRMCCLPQVEQNVANRNLFYMNNVGWPHFEPYAGVNELIGIHDQNMIGIQSSGDTLEISFKLPSFENKCVTLTIRHVINIHVNEWRLINAVIRVYVVPPEDVSNELLKQIIAGRENSSVVPDERIAYERLRGGIAVLRVETAFACSVDVMFLSEPDSLKIENTTGSFDPE